MDPLSNNQLLSNHIINNQNEEIEGNSRQIVKNAISVAYENFRLMNDKKLDNEDLERVQHITAHQFYLEAMNAVASHKANTLSISDQKLLIKKLKLAANLNHADALYQLGAYYRRENKKINRYGLEKYIKIFEQTLKIDPNHFKSKLRVGANLIVSNDNLELAQQYLFDVATEGIKQHRIATKALGILAYHFKILKSQFDKSKQNLDKLSTNLPITKNLDSIKEYSSEKKINEWCSHFIDYINLPIHAQIKTANENLYRDSKKFESLKQKLLCIYKQHIAEGIVSAYHSLANLIEYGYLDQISVEKTPFELHLTVANLGYFKSFLPVAWHYLENNDPKAIDWLNKIVEYDFDASSNQYKTDPSKCKLTKQDYEEDLRWAMEKLNDLNKEE